MATKHLKGLINMCLQAQACRMTTYTCSFVTSAHVCKPSGHMHIMHTRPWDEVIFFGGGQSEHGTGSESQAPGTRGLGPMDKAFFAAMTRGAHIWPGCKGLFVHPLVSPRKKLVESPNQVRPPNRKELLRLRPLDCKST